ncbi:MAG: transketolase family protein [Candidatus Lokiarchaeota archaeon]|nr:transketolase family protein [Candidatus Lokiarchaeota archaeon]
MINLPARDVLGNFLTYNGDKYQNMVVLNADLSLSTKSDIFAQKYPHRFFNFGIAEQNMIGASMGFAISNKMPIVCGFSLFTTGRAWEFIRLACHDNLNIKFITTHGGLVGGDGSTHSALEDLSLMACLPNLNVIVPGDNIEIVKVLEYAFRIPGPFYIRLPRGNLNVIHKKDFEFDPNAIDVIKNGNESNDICIIGIGSGSYIASQFALKLEQELHISIRILNQSTIKPINTKNLISLIKNDKNVIVIEEHNTYCGFGSIISRIISEYCPKKIKIIGIENSFGQSGSRNELLEYYGFSYKNLKKKILELLNEK